MRLIHNLFLWLFGFELRIYCFCFFTFLFFLGSFLLFLSLQVAEGVKETLFKSLEDLIRHYKRRNQGLVMHLRHSVQRKTAILKQSVKEAETQRPVSLRERQCVCDGKPQMLFFSTSALPPVFWLICLFLADPDPSDYVVVLPDWAALTDKERGWRTTTATLDDFRRTDWKSVRHRRKSWVCVPFLCGTLNSQLKLQS